MAETQFDYTEFEKDSEENRKSRIKKCVKKFLNDEENQITVKKSTVYIISIVAIVLIVCVVCDGLFMYLIANGKHDCKFILPDGYDLSSKFQVIENKSTDRTGISVGPMTTSHEQYTEQTPAFENDTIPKSCPSGWLSHGKACYSFRSESVTFLQATISCMKLGGYLVEINSAAEDQFVRTHAKQISGIECFKETPALYDGLTNTTFKGKTCQRWDSQFPHKHTRNNISRFPETSLADASNYCRDPDKEGLPWCYTTDSDIRWQFCGIYRCPGNFWIGMTGQSKQSTWMWVTSRKTVSEGSYQNWAPGEPSMNNQGGYVEYCGFLTADHRLSWGDQICFNPALYICEK